jgi:hypothetical protein
LVHDEFLSCNVTYLRLGREEDVVFSYEHEVRSRTVTWIKTKNQELRAEGKTDLRLTVKYNSLWKIGDGSRATTLEQKQLH